VGITSSVKKRFEKGFKKSILWGYAHAKSRLSKKRSRVSNVGKGGENGAIEFGTAWEQRLELKQPKRLSQPPTVIATNEQKKVEFPAQGRPGKGRNVWRASRSD
jgi:hypothetical protein